MVSFWSLGWPLDKEDNQEEQGKANGERLLAPIVVITRCAVIFCQDTLVNAWMDTHTWILGDVEWTIGVGAGGAAHFIQ